MHADHQQAKAPDPLGRIHDCKIGKLFPLQGRFPTIDNRQFDFGSLDKPAFVCFGFFGCHPCMHELPVFINAAKAHPEVNFVYITFDGEATIQREFEEAGLKDFKPGANYFVIRMDRSEIDKASLTMGYPTRYLLNETGSITYMSTGGNPSMPEGKIRARIDELIANLGTAQQ